MLWLWAVAKLSEAKRNDNFSFGGRGSTKFSGAFRFFLEKKLPTKKKSLFLFLFWKGIVILGIDKVHLALHEHIMGTLWDIPRTTTISALYTWYSYIKYQMKVMESEAKSYNFLVGGETKIFSLFWLHLILLRPLIDMKLCTYVHVPQCLVTSHTTFWSDLILGVIFVRIVSDPCAESRLRRKQKRIDDKTYAEKTSLITAFVPSINIQMKKLSWYHDY
jgi:hypothetical protein